MQKNNQKVNIERVADTSRFTKRIGSTIYNVGVYFKQDAKETIEDKILRLVRNDFNCSQKNGTMVVLQTERLPERSSI
jgi:c-di-AMP phosphodiesterase-like protein